MPSDVAVRRYRRQISVYRARTAGLLVASFDRLDTHDRGDLDTYLRTTAPALAGAKRAAVSLSAAFFSLVIGVPPVGIDPDEIAVNVNLNGPFLAMWHAFKEGRPFDEALAAGRSMAQANGFDFVQSAARRTGDHVAEASGTEVRWRRVPGAKACSWCRLVARDDYQTAESADFGHNRDDCDVMPA